MTLSLHADSFFFHTGNCRSCKWRELKNRTLTNGVLLAIMTSDENNGLLVCFIMTLDIRGRADRHIRSQHCSGIIGRLRDNVLSRGGLDISYSPAGLCLHVCQWRIKSLNDKRYKKGKNLWAHSFAGTVHQTPNTTRMDVEVVISESVIARRKNKRVETAKWKITRERSPL